jgi:crossover junction endodeoxyribonuclease RusA
MLRVKLPWPPSVNSYWRHPSRGPLAGRHLISEKGREYRKAVGFLLLRSKCVPGSLSVRIIANPPDKRRRDLDNILKALLDSLVAAGAIRDDADIDSLCITRGPVEKGGSVHVEITAQ